MCIRWETLGHISTVFACLVAVFALCWQMYTNNKEHHFSSFLTLLERYENLAQDRRQKWNLIKDTVKKNPKTANEVGDKVSTLDYLMLRKNQSEPFYAIEHGLIEREILSMNFLNQLCTYAKCESRSNSLLETMLASEISYYQNRLTDLLSLYEAEKGQRLFPKPQYDCVKGFDVSRVFDLPPKK